jgi:putative ABC transport system permease protein
LRAYTKDILRTIRKNLKRLLALIAITMLGLTAFVGINAACKDMYIGADSFFDQQNLFDIRIQSTLGLTDEDIDVLSKLDEVERASGGYSESVDLVENGQNHSADMVVLAKEGINEPYVVEGELPSKSGQIAVTQKYLDESGKKLGDTITITEIFDEESDEGETEADSETDPVVEEEEESPTFTRNDFTITALVIDPMDVSSTEGTAAFRSAATSDYSFYITEHDVDTEVYTAVYLCLKDLSQLDCYSDEYEEKVALVVSEIEGKIKVQRETARYDSIINEAREKIDDAANTMNEEFAKAEKEINDAKTTLSENKIKLSDGEAELLRNEQELNSNWQKISDGKQQLASQRSKAEAGFTEAESTFNTKQSELDAAYAQAVGAAESIKAGLGANWPVVEPAWNSLVAAAAQGGDTQSAQVALATALASLTPPIVDPSDYIKAAMALGTIQAGQTELSAQRSAFEAKKAEARAQMDAAETELAANEQKLIDGRAQIESSKQTIAQNKIDLEKGEAELAENEQSYLSEKLDAEEKIADAYAELNDIEMTQWYVQDRSSLDSFSDLDSDISSIQAIGTAFPILFLVVAVLISLTTMTRMVEEERGLIGTYKALGFGNGIIARKYLVYAIIASVLGSVLGSLIGFFALPLMLLDILSVIYTIPNVPLYFDVAYGLFGSMIFILSILAATGLACKNELKETPAALMRPKAPRQGARIFLERIPFVWNNLKFLNKVAARNLFRYKKRFFMTLIGIAGCTALVLAGFAIRDSVTEMKPKQYDEIYSYDMMVVANPDDNDKLNELIADDKNIADYLNVQLDSVKIINAEGESETVQMIVIPEGESIEPYIHILNTKGVETKLPDEGVLLTQNAAELLHIDEGEEFTIQNLQLDRATATTSSVVKNYLGNNIFISQALYEELFDAYEPNTMYVHLKESAGDHIAYAESMLDEDFVMSSVSTAGLEDQFANDFVVLNYVIYLLVVLAAGLAFVVLFTLCSTNISERMREIATIKVLGFYDKEVHSYVNKETLILTLISVICGMPLGYGLTWLILAALQMPSINFELTIAPLSYLFAGVISFSFTLIVNLMTNRVLDDINMVEALKSVE